MAETQKTADPCVMVIFGATGDLTKRKLLPALYNLAKDKFLPDSFAVVGVGRQELTREEFCERILNDLKEFAGDEPQTELIDWISERIYYTGGDLDDDKKLFSDIKELLAEVCEKHSVPENYFFYMAIPPTLFSNVAKKIVKNGMGREENGNWRRFIFEKPFGRDLETARKLNRDLLSILKERQ